MIASQNSGKKFGVTLKLLLFVFAIVLLIIGVQTWLNINSTRQRIETDEKQDLIALYNNYKSDVNVLEGSLAALASSLADRSDVQEFLLAQDRQGLLALLRPIFTTLKMDYDIARLTLLQSNGSIFARVHDPDQYGDQVPAASRQMIASALASRLSMAGVEIDANRLGVRGIAPVFDQAELIGLVEVGLDYDQTFVKDLKIRNGADYKMWVTFDAAAPAGLGPKDDEPEAPSSRFFYYAGTDPTTLPIPEVVYLDVLKNREPQIQFVSDGSQELAVLVAPLLGYGNRIIGLLEISTPRTEALASLQRSQLTTLTVAGGLLLLTLVLIWILTNVVVLRPLSHLVTVARQQLAGDLTARVELLPNDQFGQLGRTLNILTEELDDTLQNQENVIAERTAQLQLTLAVAQRLSSILDLAQLLDEVVNLVRDGFNLYHTHIYLLDEDGENLVIAEGYGEAGLEMKRQRHSIPLAASQSLVARAARKGQVIIVENVEDDSNWLPNPLLPETRSEMAVPIISGSEVLGVLDLQSEKVGGLTEEDGTTLQALANQVAIAVRNARAFAQTQEALYEAQRLQRLYTGQAWERFGAARFTTDYEYRQSHLLPLEQVTTPEVTAALEQEQTVDLRLGGAGNGSVKGVSGEPENREPSAQASKAEHALATPLKLGGEVIGVLGIRDENPERRWTEDEIALIEAVGEQMSLAVENARLFGETQHRARRETLTRQIADKIRNADSIEEILQTTVAELSKALGVSRTFIDLDTTVKPDT